MKDKNENAVSIIGGADGPTSVFTADGEGKKSLKLRAQNHIHRYKYELAEKKITAGTHTLDELITYAGQKYDLVEVNPDEVQYIEQRKELKESLILQHKPELLGEMKDIAAPDFSSEASVKEFLYKLQARSEMIAEMPDHVIPMDFHLYEIRIDEDSLEMEIDYIWNIFSISCSGNRKTMRQFQKISRDLYLYYGVNEEDIREKTQRYRALAAALSE